MKARILVAATSSGCGKTTLTVGLLRVLAQRGLRVQPFKCGPDYIDTQYHQQACGTESVNLDTWFADADHLDDVYRHYGTDADVCVVEGVMGLFDGYRQWRGSAAEVASLLRLPVVLVVNARSMAFSAAAIIRGFRDMMADLQPHSPSSTSAIVGVIFNQVGSSRHDQLLREACEAVGIPCLGTIPRLKTMEVPARHLGLTLENKAAIEAFINQAAQTVASNVDIDQLLSVCSTISEPSTIEKEESSAEKEQKNENSSSEDSSLFTLHSLPKNASLFTLQSSQKIAVARDEAFNFTYRENIDWLRARGDVVFFSPLYDEVLPPQTGFLYLPGGYPEFFLPALSRNKAMQRAVSDYIEGGGHALAECGGMMYLCRSIIDEEGNRWPMVGILAQDATMEGKRLHLGYRELNGLRGHEFHYSSVVGENPALVQGHWLTTNGEPATPYYIYKNLVAGYTHIYFPSSRTFFLP